MSLSRRVTGGLAWAGLLLVVAVPSADAITNVFIPQTGDAVSSDADQASLDSQPLIIAPIPATRRTVTPETEAAVAPVVEDVVAVDPVETASIAEAVDKFLDDGKPLPSYISGEDAAAVEPEPVAPATVTPSVETEVATIDQFPVIVETDPGIDPVEVASIDAMAPVEEPPIPMPAFMRPPSTDLATYRPGDERPADEVVLPSEGLIFPPAEIEEQDFASADDPVITSDELADWEYGPLSDYLERQQGGDSEVVIRHRSSEFDDEDRPNHRRHQRELIGPIDDDDDFFFSPFFD